MIDAVRNALALRAARRALRGRQAEPMGDRPEQRRALVVLPETREATETTWTMLDALGLDPERVLPVAVGTVSYVPDRYAGRILVAVPRGLLRLPSESHRAAAWGERSTVAINLLAPRDPIGALIVGASPAALRVGFADRKAEPFYDLLVGSPDGSAPGPDTIARTLDLIYPTLFRSS